MVVSPLPSQGHKRGGIAILPLYCQGSPTPSAGSKKSIVVQKKKENNIRFGYLTPTFTGAEERAEMLRHPCIIGDPQRQAWGAKNK